jgi:two-component system, NtrC family, response regulator HydG
MNQRISQGINKTQTPSAPRIAIIDDDPEIQVLLRELFRLEGFEVDSYTSGLEVFAVYESATSKARIWDLIVCDLMLPDLDGLQIIDRIRKLEIDTPVILITANATIETAAQALHKGAFDYIAKPINPVEMSVLAGRAIKLSQLERDYELLRKQMESETHKGTLIGRSQKIKQVFGLIDRVAGTLANVLITGESGSGKEGVARAIHTTSGRSQAPFVAINCSAIPENLLESELFGHRKGSFTGANENRTGLIEESSGGTLFLDEIGDMPLSLQSKLLRVLQERKIKPVGSNEQIEVDLRIIAATHRDLKRSITEGTFREDLFFRLNVVPIVVPPLRERIEDIPLLVEHFLTRACHRNGLANKRMSKAAVSKLMRLEWPGNVRELENAVERSVVLSERDTIEESEILTEGNAGHDKIRNIFSKLPTLEGLEREYLVHVLNETGNHKDRTAEILGINRKTLYRKEREFGLSGSPT